MFLFFLIVFQDLISLTIFLMEIPSSKLNNTTKAIFLNVKPCKTVHTPLIHQETLKCSVYSINSGLYWFTKLIVIFNMWFAFFF